MGDDVTVISAVDATEKPAKKGPGLKKLTKGEKPKKPKYGDEEDDLELEEELENGPIQDRSCTDCLCYFLYIFFCVGMVGAAAYGYMNGDPYKLISPIDYNKNLCGLTTGFETYEYSFYPAPDPNDPNTARYKYPVCVKSCPTEATSTGADCKID